MMRWRPDSFGPKFTISNESHYRKQIQKFIGNATIFSCGVLLAIVKNKNHQIVIAKRSDANIWAFPGGGKELHEPILTTFETEIMEELGLEIENPSLIALCSGNSFRVTYPSGSQIQYLGFLFKADYRSGSLKVNDNENIAIAWVNQDELSNMLSKGHKRFWETYQR